MTFREIEDLRIKEQTDLHNAKENERLERTAPYQEALNKKYGGTVTVKENTLTLVQRYYTVVVDVSKSSMLTPYGY
ncbi:hypothetical protein CKQ70_31230 [Bacillus toyonensis]|nr:hypothetical protein CKQ70_31230 [Bacillus toyonensis]